MYLWCELQFFACSDLFVVSQDQIFSIVYENWLVLNWVCCVIGTTELVCLFRLRIGAIQILVTRFLLSNDAT